MFYFHHRSYSFKFSTTANKYEIIIVSTSIVHPKDPIIGCFDKPEATDKLVFKVPSGEKPPMYGAAYVLVGGRSQR